MVRIYCVVSFELPGVVAAQPPGCINPFVAYEPITMLVYPDSRPFHGASTNRPLRLVFDTP